MGEYLLGIDLGTTACKVAAFNTRGELIAVADVEYPIYYPKPGWAEQNAEDWWRAASEGISKVLKKINPKDIVGISVSGQREGVAPMTKEGEVLDRVILWMDRRSVPQAEWIKNNFDVREIYNITGLMVDSTFTASKLLWIKEHKGWILEKTYKFLQPKDYIVYKLTGRFVTDHSIASRTMLFDVINRKWSDKLFEYFGLPRDKFPDAYPADEVIGEVCEEASITTGLKVGTPVVAGGGDRPMEALGAGVIDPKKICEATGTGLSATVTLEKPLLDKKMRFLVGAHVIRKKWALELGIGVVGAVLRWFRDNFGKEEKELAEHMGIRSYELLDMAAQLVPPGSSGLIVVPMFMGARVPRWNPYVKGVIFGLTLAHTRIHIARAIMEGATYEFRYALETLEELGLKFSEIRCLGGGGKTPFWASIKANVTNKKVLLMKQRESGVLGDAILAGVGVGIFKSFEDAVSSMVKIDKVITPNPKVHEVYEKYYRLYLKLVDVLMPIYDELRTLPEGPRGEVPWTQDKLVHLLDKLMDNKEIY